MPLLEIGIVLALTAILIFSYYIVTETGRPDTPLRPEFVAALLVAILVPAVALMVLVARRLAIRRAARSGLGGRARLHVRLVALFSILAAVPTLLVVIFASLLFQNGVQFWFSEQAQTVLESARNASQVYEAEHRERIRLDVEAMGADMVDRINRYGLDNETFVTEFLYQTQARLLYETAIVTVSPTGEVQKPVEWNPDGRKLADGYPPERLVPMQAGQAAVAQFTRDRVEAIVRLDPEAAIYFYATRLVSPEAISQLARTRESVGEYRQTLDRSRDLQLRFNAILLVVSLLIVALAIWIALALAERLVRPVRYLVDAARGITAGDLSVRVPNWRSTDEIGTLGKAFNRMTSQLEGQTGALVGANRQLENRRAFIEAVLSGVTAGIVSVDRDRNIQLINSSAETLLRTSQGDAVGRRLAELAPELDRHLDTEEGEDVVQISRGGEAHTLAVKRVRADGGHVLTFDDITEQLLDQRRAAWSDVARRIAHEIKNPLTPIQLAAERLQRRYGKEIESDPATFERLTGTIVRQVGDLRRMVDEFSSFARMPKPVFECEAIVDIARQALFLHEVAHPDISFSLEAPEASPMLVCDRRLLGQALTNIVKNGVEAIQQKWEESGGDRQGERIAMTIRLADSRLTISVSDSGVGLPADRRRLTEPYMTTRTKGTGLGLAIVKKIVEEHFGMMEFEDEEGGGTCVRLTFDLEMLSRMNGGTVRASEETHADG
jgi:two-component system nitrogen regulation sensor histidine kinase NtrY